MLRSLLRRLRGGDDARSNARSDSAHDAERGSGADGSGEDDPDAETDSGGDEESEQAPEEAEEEGSLWDLIQPWQYRGQYVQSGGDVRDEQERALRDIQRQAEEIEGSDTQHEPPAEK